MTQSVSAQPWFSDPPATPGDADAWARWTVEFLDGLSRRWSDWRKTWKPHDVPVFRQGIRDAWLYTDRVTRQVATDHKLVPGEPPREICDAPALLDKCSHAVQRFSARSAWIFTPAEQADEIAQAMLKVASAIKNGRYHEVGQAHLEGLGQLVKLATRRSKNSAASRNTMNDIDDSRHNHTPDVASGPEHPESASQGVVESATIPASTGHLKPSHAKAKALYDWAMDEIPGAADMTYVKLFEALTGDLRCAGEGLPDNAAAFARYCRAAGVRRNTPRSAKGATRSVPRASDL